MLGAVDLLEGCLSLITHDPDLAPFLDVDVSRHRQVDARCVALGFGVVGQVDRGHAVDALLHKADSLTRHARKQLLGLLW